MLVGRIEYIKPSFPEYKQVTTATSPAHTNTAQWTSPKSLMASSLSMEQYIPSPTHFYPPLSPSILY
jgi:hypothetical protein